MCLTVRQLQMYSAITPLGTVKFCHFVLFYDILRFMDNSPTNQLADNQVADRPTRRQFNSPTLQLADKPTRRNWYMDVSAHAEMQWKVWKLHSLVGRRVLPPWHSKLNRSTVDRFSLERRGDVLSITSNACQWIGVMYETRSDWKQSMQNNSIGVLKGQLCRGCMVLTYFLSNRTGYSSFMK